MNRLTNRTPDGTAYVVSETGEEGVGYLTTQRRLKEVISRLATYEDTGLTPKEVDRQKAEFEALQMDNKQLQSDIINANQNNDHIKELWEDEKEKVAKAKQKVINACKELQAAKAEIERLQKIISGQKHAIFEQQSYTEELQKQLKTAEDRVIKDFAERLCEGRVPNDPVAIAVKVELDEYKEKRGLI